MQPIVNNSLAVTAILLLAGCASSNTEPILPADHPGNPSAMEGPPIQRSRTLDLDGSETASAMPDEKSMDDTARGMGDASMPNAVSPPRKDAQTVYACPMHPEVTSDTPDHRCPKCNMLLKPVSRTGGAR